MTRTKEPEIGTTQVPKYKSPPLRIIRSLRKGYDNLREKISKKSDDILGLRGELRDVKQSREIWKQRCKETESENACLKETIEKLQGDLKKRDRST